MRKSQGFLLFQKPHLCQLQEALSKMRRGHSCLKKANTCRNSVTMSQLRRKLGVQILFLLLVFILARLGDPSIQCAGCCEALVQLRKSLYSKCEDFEGVILFKFKFCRHMPKFWQGNTQHCFSYQGQLNLSLNLQRGLRFSIVIFHFHASCCLVESIALGKTSKPKDSFQSLLQQLFKYFM